MSARPVAPQIPECDPEEPVDLAEGGEGLFPFEHDQLLAKSSGFQPELMARNEVRANISESHESKPDHHSDAMRNGIVRFFRKPSFRGYIGFLMTDREYFIPDLGNWKEHGS